MPYFSSKSKERLYQCDTRLKILFDEVIKYWDCTIVCGHRDETDQKLAFATGKSKLDWPNSKHNHFPSTAVDVAPCIDGKPSFESKLCYVFGGYVLRIAEQLGIHGLRWGGDWDGDRNISDQKFNDIVHWEVR